MSEITEKHQGYFQGYQDGREDMRKVLSQELWAYANAIEKLDDDLHSLITKLILDLEKKR